MSDEEPLRPTLDDHVAAPVRPTEPAEEPALPAPDPPPAPPRPPMSPARAFAIAMAVFVAIAVVAGVAVYLFVIRYSPVARRHIPGNANLVAHVDLAAIATFPPFRDHFLPILRDKSEAKTSLSDRIERETGIDMLIDPRELVIASTDGSSVVGILGGRFKKGLFVRGIEAIAKQEGWSGWIPDGDLFVGPGGVAIAQADDGTIVFGTDRAIVAASLPASDDDKRLDLPSEGAVTFAITHEAWGGASSEIANLVAHATVLHKVDRANGVCVLGDPPSIEMTIVPNEGEDPIALARDLDRTLAELRVATLLLPDAIGEKDALAVATVSAKQGKIVIDAAWPLAGLDRGAKRVAGLFGR